MTDSGASCDIVNDKALFSFMSSCSIDVGGIGSETATAKGTVWLVIKTAEANLVILILENLSYIPTIKWSLISLICISNSDTKFDFGKGIVIVTLSFGR